MTRTALQKFLGHLVLAGTLPLAGCITGGGDCRPPERNIVVTLDGGLPADGAVDDAGCAELCLNLGLSIGEVKQCQVSSTMEGATTLSCTSQPVCL